ncbi:MAG TPA: UDP-N-acetylmuramoyl-L-alanine--D-glutamate ligase [Dehalococcoidia bacterium]|nr:UDP-N-acetylmuramoyl-L-alanine--D-glutamate ligase [Dehalococcoidia bacterium]
MTGKRDFLVGKRVTVIGLGIEGVDVAGYAAAHGATVAVFDSKPPEALAARIQQLEGAPINYVLGRQTTEGIADSDIVFVSQSVPLDSAPVAEARAHGVPIDSMVRFFMEQCPGPTIGITGSSGKTTTTSLVAAILAADGRAYRVGGNIGTGLLGLLDGIDERTWTVMELSHTQLQLIDRGPHIAAVLNVTPNHLDQFTWDEYVALKQAIVRSQTADDIAVLNFDDEISSAMSALTPATIWHFTLDDELPGDGALLRDDAVFVRRGNVEEMVLPARDIPLRGQHNVANVLAATAIAAAAGVRADVMARAVRAFTPVPHRLEDVAEVAGVRYVNDSIATTPERALAGIRSFDEPLVLLLGGKDKDLPKDELAQDALRRCHGIVFFGADGALLEAAVEANAAFAAPEDRPTTVRVVTLAEAVRDAREMAEPGDVVLLSPACTSFDAYANFEERGEEFRRIVHEIAAEEGR